MKIANKYVITLIHNLWKAASITLTMISAATACTLWQQGFQVEEVPHKQEWQSQAQSVSVSQFFNYRMQNRLRKALVGNWMILHEDAQFVYFGYPRFAGIFDDRRLVEILYRVPLTELNQVFPGWRQCDGIWVQNELQKEYPGQGVTQWQAQLKGEQIFVQGQLGSGKAFELILKNKNKQ